MSKNFKVGQTVVCIKPTHNLKKNEIYTISFIEDDACRLVELEFEPRCEGYFLFRFKPLDYSFTDNLLRKIKEESLTQIL